MFLTIRRTFREAIQNFIRNGWLSIATVSILILSLYVLSVFFVVTSTANGIMKDVQGKVNISIYFKPDVSEQAIAEIKADLENFSEVKSVGYVSKEQALDDFKRNNASEPIILQSLDEIGGNPLLASLIVKAGDPTRYQAIVDHISQASFSSEISRINYGKNKEIIDKLNSIVATIKRIGTVLGVLFAAISLLITFNAVRITIYTHKQEIEIMRLVGASNYFIRMPFIFEGMIYGVMGSVFSMLILFLSVRFVTPYVSSAIPSSNLIDFYFSNFGILLGGQMALGVFLGVIGSLIAMRRYLRV
ncbi:MAG: permease-like cell division protein FtsX [Candidatus Moranbacteria bacterium]|nr:permease-like cell division protein FtsX [bacterium]MDP1833503.1 permease-like cell division protein FtsX [Candidatus Moranbacteria bacterium]